MDTKGPVMPPVITGYGTGYATSTTSESDTSAITGYRFPIGEGRALTGAEAAHVRALAASGDYNWRGELSLTKLCQTVYGSKDDKRMNWIRDALETSTPTATDDKVIKLRRAG